jgi:hypothetical protein
MRPMESDGDHFLTYYLTKDDEAAEQFKESRADPRGINALQEEEEVRNLSSLPLSLIFNVFITNRRQNFTLCATMRWSKSNKKYQTNSSSFSTTAIPLRFPSRPRPRLLRTHAHQAPLQLPKARPGTQGHTTN